ncbi:LysR family transcriptional regulator [Leucobacter japonicus]|uniref:LysR family transcriptional regulator n=1 Tax=Leucobacter japonicus TaxID=1461259 RepID=UPI0006A7E229|nr:LysR family transcriptional regulator [Leucobacter japonicus]
MLEVKRLRLLWELSRRGTVIAVAEALSYSPSAVSQQLSILEREVGMPLLTRSGRTLRLTAAARSLVAHTEQLLADLERADDAVRRFGTEVIGTLRVAAFQTALLAIMPQALRRMRAEHPAVRVEVVQHEPAAALYETWARGFDLVVAEQYPGHATEHFAGLDRQPLTRDAIQLALPAHAGVDPEFDAVFQLSDAASLPWVMEPVGAASRHWAEQACRVAGFEPDVRFETADLQAHLRLVESGLAVALLPGMVHVGRASDIRLIDLPGDPERTVFTASRHSSADSPALDAFRAILSEEAERRSLAHP